MKKLLNVFTAVIVISLGGLASGSNDAVAHDEVVPQPGLFCVQNQPLLTNQQASARETIIRRIKMVHRKPAKFLDTLDSRSTYSVYV